MTFIIQTTNQIKYFYRKLAIFSSVEFTPEFLTQWAKLSKKAGYILLTFISLNILGLSGWIQGVSYWLFPTHETQQLLGLIKTYEVNSAREPFVFVIWVFCWLIFFMLMNHELQRSLSVVLSNKKLIAKTAQCLVGENLNKEPSAIPDNFDQTIVMTPILEAKFKQEQEEVKLALEKEQESSRYRITKELGKGAMGVVYLAQDSVLHREVALKSLSVQLASQQAFSERFYREARMVAKLNHPNIVQIYDFTEQAGKFMIAMEFVKGSPLDELMELEALTKSKVYDIATQIAISMEYAHQRGVIHRDLKPANVLINEEGQVKLTDFGLAKINGTNETQVGTIMGSPLYMSPEQAKGDTVDHRADIYSFGIMFYQLLMGKVPFSGESALEVVAQHLTKALPLDTETCAGLTQADKKLLSLLTNKLPEDRIQSFEQVITLLKSDG